MTGKCTHIGKDNICMLSSKCKNRDKDFTCKLKGQIDQREKHDYNINPVGRIGQW